MSDSLRHDGELSVEFPDQIGVGGLPIYVGDVMGTLSTIYFRHSRGSAERPSS